MSGIDANAQAIIIMLQRLVLVMITTIITTIGIVPEVEEQQLHLVKATITPLVITISRITVDLVAIIIMGVDLLIITTMEEDMITVGIMEGIITTTEAITAMVSLMMEQHHSVQVTTNRACS